MSDSIERDPQALRPPPTCMKCGDPLGFAFDPPRFVPAPDWVGRLGKPLPGWLQWQCRNCDYRVTTKTVDAL